MPNIPTGGRKMVRREAYRRPPNPHPQGMGIMAGLRGQPERGSLASPFTDSMAPPAPQPQSGPQLARAVSNAGTNGSNARYHVGPGSGLTRGERGWTDGVYWYDENGLSLDRPDAFVQGLGPANESENYDPWSGRSPSIGGQAPPGAPSPNGGGGPQVPRGLEFSRALLAAGQGGEAQGVEGAQGMAGDPQGSLASLLEALIGRVPGQRGRNSLAA